MLNKVKTKALISVGAVAATSFILMMGYTAGQLGISFDIGHPNRLIFCESFINLMSYYELHQQSLTDVRLVSMEGLKRSVVAYQTLRLIAEENQKLEFLDTVIPSKLLPLINTIRDTTSYFDHHPDLLTLAVDCDDAGKDFLDKFVVLI